MTKSIFTLLTFVSINLLSIIPGPNWFIFHNGRKFKFFLFFDPWFKILCCRTISWIHPSLSHQSTPSPSKLFNYLILRFCDMFQIAANFLMHVVITKFFKNGCSTLLYIPDFIWWIGNINLKWENGDINMLLCPHIIISEYNQTYPTSPSCYYVLDLLCVTVELSKCCLSVSSQYTPQIKSNFKQQAWSLSSV